MAYQRPAYDSRSPHDSERSRPAWDPLQRPHYSSMPSPSHHSMPSPGFLDPESESSDVSDDPGDDYRIRGHPVYPIVIPPAPAKSSPESLDSIETRLRELQRVEDHNIRRQEHLKAKRARKDQRIRQKREAQDARIKMIMDTRVRHDERINRRRKLEDEAFERFDQDLEEEENNLRRRQKRLKRGLPVEDAVLVGSRISSASMSPPGPTYSSIPPPPKRHQTGPPGQSNSPVTSNPRPTPPSTVSAPASAAPNPPPYAFLQSSHPPASTPYGHSPIISHSPSGNHNTFQPTPRPHQQHGQPSPYTLNGHPPSPQIPHPSPANAHPNSILNTAPPPRQPSTYDTRPPPPSTSSGFATINTPPTSGFAAINPRNAATPPAPANMTLAKPAEHDRPNGYTRPYTTEGTPTGGSTMAGGKRTPSTTHPYQMSEAFANRHHHCERTDHLNRGIWTSFGPGGTKEMPTGPHQEMYLRCNHDGCRRIDWRTVHGLQCHIVKNHEQPKGTIGSLEKALDRYGVPVIEVEAYEREHGDGSGGTMADPKNFKLKMKPGYVAEKMDGQRKPIGPQPISTAPRPNMPVPPVGSRQPYQESPTFARSLHREGNEGSEAEPRMPPISLGPKPPQLPQILQPPSGFSAVNGAWSTIPSSKPAESKDIVMKDAPPSPHSPSASGVPKRDATFWKMWPEGSGTSRPEIAGHVPGPTLAPSSMRMPSAAAPMYQFSGNVASAQPTSSTPHTPMAAVQTPNPPSAPSTPLQVTQKQTKPSPKEYTKEPQPLTAVTNQHIARDQQGANNNKEAKQSEITQQNEATKQSETPKPTTEGPLSPPASVSASTPAPIKETINVKETSKESEKPKAETAELSRVEPRSPAGMTRRASLIGGRRESSRRSSIAAIRAEKEREKEREGVTVVGATAPKPKPEPQTDAKQTPERQAKELNQDSADVDHGKWAERDGNQSRDEDSDDPDTIKVRSGTSKDNDDDRDKDGKENKTTPRRMANGRFLRRTQYR